MNPISRLLSATAAAPIIPLPAPLTSGSRITLSGPDTANVYKSVISDTAGPASDFKSMTKTSAHWFSGSAECPTYNSCPDMSEPYSAPTGVRVVPSKIIYGE
jgi:hypothetical protein